MNQNKSLKWGFSTLGTPSMSFNETVEFANRHNIHYIEVRTIENSTNIPNLFEKRFKSVDEINNILKNNNVSIIGLNSGFKLTSNDKASKDELLGFAKWADLLNVPFIRIFGGNGYGVEVTKKDYNNAKINLEWWKEEKQKNNWNVDIFLETHDVFLSTDRILRLFDYLKEPINLIWDSHHTYRHANEDFDYTWNKLSEYIFHVHVKDSVNKPSLRHCFTYMLPGKGDIPINDLLELLVDNKFQHVVSLEWELPWHSYLPPLEDAIIEAKKIGWF